MKNKKLIEDVFEYILSLFFPNRCRFCDNVIQALDEICDDCMKSLPWINGEICSFCGSLKADCGCNGRHGQYYDGIVAPLYYTDTVRTCIHRYKFRDDKLLYKCLADLMSKACIERYGDIKFDYITYTPMIKKSQKKRGYNQSELLAGRIAENLDIPFAGSLLIKKYDTKFQRKCSGFERTGNIVGVFDVNDIYDVENKTILLIDDVKTSGCTLSECGKMLYLNGAQRVYCLTAALVKSKIDKDD